MQLPPRAELIRTAVSITGRAMAICLFLCTVHAGSLAAQRVTGTVVEGSGLEPVAFALVELLDGRGLVLSRTQTNPQGVFQLAWHPSAQQVRAGAIGFTDAESAVFEAGTMPPHLRLVLDTQPVALNALEVTAERVCRIGGETNAVSVAWYEARRALASAALVERDRSWTLEGYTFRRRLDADSTILSQAVRQFAASGSQPFRSLPAVDLEADGYIRREGPDYVYYAPNADVLLSPEFEASHCFGLTRRASEPNLLGVTFLPAPAARSRPGIAGTAWLDVQSHELQWVEFHYVNAASIPFADHASGRVEVRVVPSGGRVVSRWSIRTPVAATQSRLGMRAANARVTEFQEEGGEITSLRAGAVAWDLGSPGSIRGLVFDSTSSAPLVGATVAIQGTAFRTRTDGAGRFELRDLPAGSYRVGLLHPRLDSLPPGPPPSATVTVVAGAAADVLLAVPPVVRGVVAACGAESGALPSVYGVVRDRQGTPVAGAGLTVSWDSIFITPQQTGTLRVTRTGESDERGRFILCDVSPNRRLAVEISASGGSWEPVTLQSERIGPTFQAIRLVPQPYAAAGSSDAATDSAAAAADLVVMDPLRVTAERTRLTPWSGIPMARATARLAGSRLAALETSGVSFESLLRNLSGIRVRMLRDARGQPEPCVESSRGAGSITGASGCQPIVLVIDGIPSGFLDSGRLRSLASRDFESIEFLTGPEAGNVFGMDAGARGVLILWSRGTGPHQDRERQGG
jgi:hypothetical protein